jgi:hypothetical protein
MRIRVVTLGKISALLIILSLGLPIPSQAAVYWEDGFEPGKTGFSLAGGMSYTTNPLRSGSQALKEYFCNADTSQCGSYSHRSFPGSSEVYGRFFFRMQSGFKVSSIGTKLFNFDGGSPSGGKKHNFWLEMRNGSTNLSVIASGIPVNGIYNAKAYGSSFSFSPDQWYCVETHIKENTPDLANGLLELWVNGSQVLYAPNQMFMQTGINATDEKLTASTLYVQLGYGYLYWDDIAVGTTRIGCSVSLSTDSAPPATPVGVGVQ